ncbi:hypothetical protein V6N13_028453 [Hibiscus sabdariffa]|uniref:Uncharacterized protein n=1 Tax=Hibiscus sabdariffa TaxID=183260 RepID=A0ABR2DAC3_9ROSI
MSKHGFWVEWSSSLDNNESSHEGDTPQEKRQRLSNPADAVEAKLSKLVDIKDCWIYLRVKKHLILRSKTCDPAKFTKYLMPRGSEPRGTKNKIELKENEWLYPSPRCSIPQVSNTMVSASNAQSERINKGKLAPAATKLTKIEEKIFNAKSTKASSDVFNLTFGQ